MDKNDENSPSSSTSPNKMSSSQKIPLSDVEESTRLENVEKDDEPKAIEGAGPEERKTSESNTVKESNQESKKKKDVDTLLHHLIIAHELAENEDISQVMHRQKEMDRSEEIMRSSMMEAYWNLFREDITQEPPRLDLAFDILNQIKKGLEVVMTPNIVSLREQIAEVLDVNTLRMQAEHGALDVMHYAKFIISIIAKICAPIRDEAVAKLARETDIVAIFRGIVEILSQMKYDLLSFSLSVIKPDIVANHLGYERDTFREYVEAIGGNLPITKAWLLKHKVLATDEPNDVIHLAFLDLLTWDSSQPYPETLFLEKDRLEKIRLDYFRLTVSSTLLFISLSLLPQESSAREYDNIKESMKQFICILMSDVNCEKGVTNICMNIAMDLATKITHLEKSPTPSTLSDLHKKFEMLEQSLKEAVAPDNKIRTLVCTRVKDYLKISIKYQCENAASVPSALTLFKRELLALKLLFERIYGHNMVVCLEHYHLLLAED